LRIDDRARNGSGARNGLRFALRGFSALLAILFVTSCGNDIFLVGTSVITLTAQRGNFTSYLVNIDEIEMTRKDGTVIELPIVNQRVDLANLGDTVQILGAPPIGVGEYVSATFLLDYSSAAITVAFNGQATATVLTDASTSTTPAVDTITVTFDPNNPLVINNQQTSLVNFNIDLEASNTIDFPAYSSPMPVTVHPFFTATSQPVYTQPLFSRGVFVFADTKAGNFVMNTRPLHDLFNGEVGALTVIPNDQTYYNINGVTYTGAAGLTALAALQGQTATLQIGVFGTGPGTPTPIGSLNGIQPSFNATQVYAGTSQESTIQDHITGIVSGISGDTITVTGASLFMGLSLSEQIGNNIDGYSQSIPVTVGSSTIVSADGVPGNYNLQSVSVGQLISVSGVASVDTTTFNPTALDATGGQIRLEQTTLWGFLNSATPGSLSLQLLQLENFTYTSQTFSFTGTGSSSGQDATAANYTVNTGSTDESATPANTFLQVTGLANTFGQGPPYFNATTITPASSLEQELVIEYSGTGSLSPFGQVSPVGISVNLTDAALSGTVHSVITGVLSVDLLNQSNPTTVQIIPATATATSPVLFGIGNLTVSTSSAVSPGETLFTDPTAFANRISGIVNGSLPVIKIVAKGTYDPNASTFTARYIEIVCGYTTT
jgi:hypothetical protein